MKLKLTGYVTDGTGAHAPGDILDIDLAEYERLIRLDVAEPFVPRKKLESVPVSAPISQSDLEPEQKNLDLFESDEADKSVTDLSALNLDEKVVDALRQAGIESVEELKGATVEELVALAGLTKKNAEKILASLAKDSELNIEVKNG
jgi:DNA-directed RNA polymerase alpha subunit